MDVDALREMVEEDRAAGRTPFLVVAAAGTTNTGAIDPIAAIADVAAERTCGSTSTPRTAASSSSPNAGAPPSPGSSGRTRSRWTRTKGCSCRTGPVRSSCATAPALREAHFVGAAYLQDFPPEDELPNFTEYSPELSRDFRGLRVWFPLVLHGVDAFREALDEKLDLARYLYEELSAIPELELPWEPELTVVPFRLATARPRATAPARPDQRLQARRALEHGRRGPVHDPRVHPVPPDPPRPDRGVRGDRPPAVADVTGR